MSYVMVPVPEDSVADVMQFVVRLMSQAAIEPWTQDAVTEIFEEVDELTRALLSAVAMASLSEKPLPESDAAKAIELNWRETMGILRELNDASAADSHAPIVVRRTITETLPNGRTRDVRVLTMSEEVAGFVHAADRAQLLADGHVLGPSADGG
jgi:hypothetical protein